ncbi:hypothetical protein ACFVX6_16005 [Streptomyces sp. NPDC058289]|uniref:hypothetical protein n=1 Tax=Streptomyces sp. NPDC058289 TaxID=3346425 RepID=UPI0036EE0DBE
MGRGIAVDDRCIGAFRELKEKRDVNTVIYRLADSADSLVVEGQGNLTHDELLLALPADQPRLVLYDLPFASEDGTRQNRIVSICWLPASATPQDEPACSQAQTALADAVDGDLMAITATALSDLAYPRLVAQAN